MRYRPTSSILIFAAVLLAASCGGTAEDSEPADSSELTSASTANDAPASEGDLLPEVPSTESESAASESIETAGIALQAALFFDENPIADVGVVIEMYTATLAALDALTSSLPSVGEVESTKYAPFLEALGIWESDATSTLRTVADRRAELQEANDEYLASGVDGPPPQEFTALIDVNFDLASLYETACLELAVDLGVSMSCLTPTAPPPDPDGGGPEIVDGGRVSVEVGTFTGTIEAGPVEDILNTVDFVVIDFGSTLTITPPPDVVAPGADLGEAISDAVPWPDDLAAWATGVAESIAVIDVGEVELGALTWRVAVIEATSDEPVALITNPVHPEGAYLHMAGRTLQVWEASVDNQLLVAILQVSRPGADADVAVERAESILATLM